MVTGVLNDSTNQPTKRPKRMRSEQSKDRPSTSKILFAPKTQTFPTDNLLPMPKALTASLPVFDGKSEKFELFEDLFSSKIKMYPHLTEIQKINYFYSLLRGNALQAYCNLDDTKKDNLEEVITAFKRRFGDFQSAAKAKCEWDALHFDPTMNFSTYCKKLPKKRLAQKPRNSLAKPYTLKCRITSKRPLIGPT